MRKKFMKKIMTMALAFSLSTAVLVPSTSVFASEGAMVKADQNYGSSHSGNYSLNVHSYLQRSGKKVSCEVHFSGLMTTINVDEFDLAKIYVWYNKTGDEADWILMETKVIPRMDVTNAYGVTRFKFTTTNKTGAQMKITFSF